MTTIGKTHTQTYKNYKKTIKSEFERYHQNNVGIPVIGTIILTVVVLYHWLEPVFSYIYKPQETFGWFFLAICGACAFIIGVLCIAMLLFSLFDGLVSKIYYKLKFEFMIRTKQFSKAIKAECRQMTDDIIYEFLHFPTSQNISSNRRDI